MVAPKLAHELPAVERLREVLDFDFEAGVVRWSQSAPPFIRGRIIKQSHHSGYAFVQVDKKRVGLHRAIWAAAHGEWPSGSIDHIDGNPNNNALSNLRQATIAENAQNRKIYKNNSTGHPGVSLRVGGKWVARMGANGGLYLGTFSTKEAAVAAYEAADATRGEFSRKKEHR